MMYNTKLEENYICENLMADRTQIPKDIRNGGYKQLSLFDCGMTDSGALEQPKIIADEISTFSH